ncbi:hypothetical protein FA15DRAFT_671062 [Coprinopsis marcescibilis]|uniref:Uncharacterized protein n=1 Tax=Coprinopsis marcescibilis TaxID=230819 RepID=A0A5C3KQQ0_COPMA|nr:hypothetical protein FA15DRAFT_671062 [Coprinopsis marcescibilis]
MPQSYNRVAGRRGDDDDESTITKRPGGIREFLNDWGVLINTISQSVTLIAAFVFGVWAILSYRSAELSNTLSREANNQGQHSNMVALLSLCQDASGADQAALTEEHCSVIFERAIIANIVDQIFQPPPPIPSPTITDPWTTVEPSGSSTSKPSGTSRPTQSPPSLSFYLAVTVAVLLLALGGIFIVSYHCYKRTK